MGFHPVVVLPPEAVVLDLSGAWPDQRFRWSVGRYDEVRGIYTQPLFAGVRRLHVGVDLGGPAHTAVHSFADGVVRYAGTNPAPGDYGPTLVTEHLLDDRPPVPARWHGQSVWALFGHLSAASLVHSPVGRRVSAGDVLGWLGEPHENGGWPPHVHFQLSRDDPGTHDLPGVVAEEDRDAALLRFPDPRRVLGPLW